MTDVGEGKEFSYVVAIYAYDKQHPDEISFQQGDRIKVLEKHQTGWWTGEIKGADGQIRIGNFPSNFVRAEEPSEAPTPSTGTTSQNGAGFTTSSMTADENSCGAAYTSTYRDRRLRMSLRNAQLLSIIISFALGADQDSYSEYVEFRALVGIGVLVFFYILGIITAYVFNVEARWTSCLCIHQNPFNLTEAVGDAIFSIILLGGLIAALDKSRSIDNTSKAKASGVFAFLTLLLLIGTSIISWRLFMEPQKKLEQ
mmetsp:Transcript_13198/g.18283  ORF Transcript_13198/g.18283 Transcript_13198/m.18283 type:complete len:256 (+) Transcript_13198:104-871(+)